jgi:hypothetical protein
MNSLTSHMGARLESKDEAALERIGFASGPPRADL